MAQPVTKPAVTFRESDAAKHEAGPAAEIPRPTTYYAGAPTMPATGLFPPPESEADRDAAWLAALDESEMDALRLAWAFMQ